MKTHSLLLAIALCSSALAGKGLALKEAEALALAKNPKIPAAAAKVEAAKASAAMLTSQFSPQLSLNGYYGRGSGSMLSSGLFDMPPSTGIGVANAMLEWKLFSFGQSDSLRQQGNREVQAAEAELRMVKLDVLHELRVEFAMGLKFQDLIEGLNAQLDAAKELERITNEKYDAGKVPQAYVFRAKADRLRVERQLAMAEADLQAALAGVAVCCGADITDGRLAEWDVPMDAPETYDKAMEQALASSPEVASLTAEGQSYGFRESAAMRSGLPQLSLLAMGDLLSKDLMGSSIGSQVGLLLSMPLTDGGQRRQEATEARAKRLALRSQIVDATNRVRQGVVTAWSQWLASVKVVEAGLGELEAAAEAYRIAKIRYEEGKSIQAEVSQSLANLQLARADLAESLEYRRLAWSHLIRAIGTL